MYLTDVLGLIVGLIFVWLLISVVVEQVQEWIVGWLSIRSDSLADTIWGMLNDPKKRAGPWGRLGEQFQKFFERRGWFQDRNRLVPPQLPGLVKEFYAHPLISQLSQGSELAQGKELTARTNFPSYIPAETFAKTLFEIVMSAGSDESVIQKAVSHLEMALPDFVEDSVEDAVRAQLASLTQLAQDVAEEEGRLADLHKAVNDFKTLYPQYVPYFNAALQAELPKDANKLLKQIEAGAVNLVVTNPDLARILDGIIKEAKSQTKKAEDAIVLARTSAETWFNNTMDRASGWYKRNRQVGAFVIAFILALFLNVDSMAIGIELWRDPILREAVETAAIEQAQKETAPTETELKETLSALRIPFGWRFDAIEKYDPAAHYCTPFPDEEAPSGKEDMGGIPFNGQCRLWTNPPRGWGWPAKVLGIFITAFAGMQGAPFWFDILQKVVNLRSSGTKPEENAD